METLSDQEGAALISLARHAIENHLGKGSAAPNPLPLFEKKMGAFVTLRINGKERGCIGSPNAKKPLREALPTYAIVAATEDGRFPPIAESELPFLEIELSLLSPPLPINPDEIEIGTHGLLISQGDSAALFLPQVAIQYGWTRDVFLEKLCAKAHLPKGSWKEGISAFTAQTFTLDSKINLP